MWYVGGTQAFPDAPPDDSEEDADEDENDDDEVDEAEDEAADVVRSKNPPGRVLFPRLVVRSVATRRRVAVVAARFARTPSSAPPPLGRHRSRRHERPRTRTKRARAHPRASIGVGEETQGSIRASRVRSPRSLRRRRAGRATHLRRPRVRR